MTLPENPLTPSSYSPPSASLSPLAPAKTPAAFSVLIVDADTGMVDLVKAAAVAISRRQEPGEKNSARAEKENPAPPEIHIRLATSVDSAQAEMLRKPADLILVNLQIGDHAGVELIGNLKRRFPRTNAVALSRSKRADLCLDAWRAGASDMLTAPFQAEELQRVLAVANRQRLATDSLSHRNQRLRVVCRRLNKARHEISNQVDLLCNDLVRAYQQMAHQLNLTQTAADYAQTLAGEVDVEGVLRRTMEWLLQKRGPINAAIYLPSGDDHFGLGAYLNLDTQADALLIETLGKTIVDQARGPTPLSIDTDAMLQDLFGHDAESLLGRQWLAVGCRTRRECLAVLVLFRASAGEDTAGMGLSSAADRELIEAIAPILAERIEQALGIHQRLHPFSEEESDEDTGEETDD